MQLRKRLILVAFIFGFGFQSCAQNGSESKADKYQYEIQKTEAEWKAELTEKEYEILREKGTERAFTGKYDDFKKKGIYVCAACSTPLFSSETKFDSGTGWPSFYKPLNEENIREVEDNALGMKRTEVVCATCGGHIGHVFPDGPKPTGLRYCLNSVALDFKAKE